MQIRVKFSFKPEQTDRFFSIQETNIGKGIENANKYFKERT